MADSRANAAADPLLVAVQAAVAQGDPERLDAARQAYLEGFAQGPVAAEMRYRLGLSRLFRHQDPDGAVEYFKAAAAEKGAPVAAEARVSLALVYMGKNKKPQAIFELKKLLPEGAQPTVHTCQALDFLSLLLRDTEAQSKDVMAIDEKRKQHLGALAQAATDPVEKAHFLLRLAAAHADGGTGQDVALARKKYEEVTRLKDAGESAVQSARAALKILPR